MLYESTAKIFNQNDCSVTSSNSSRNRILEFTNHNCFTVRKTLPNYASFELPLPSAWNYSLSLYITNEKCHRLWANYIELYYDCCVPPLLIDWFFFTSFAKKKAQSYSSEERKGRLETLKEIVKMNQGSNEPVTCYFAG